jgi:hypothetical protein
MELHYPIVTQRTLYKKYIKNELQDSIIIPLHTVIYRYHFPSQYMLIPKTLFTETTKEPNVYILHTFLPLSVSPMFCKQNDTKCFCKLVAIKTIQSGDQFTLML